MGRGLDEKVPSSEIEDARKSFETLSANGKKQEIENFRETCNNFLKTDAAGDKETFGYGFCCEVLEICGGISGWWIFFIIVIVIGCLAAAGAAFWFFYLQRKMGGRDEKEETGEKTNGSAQSGYEISVDTY